MDGYTVILPQVEVNDVDPVTGKIVPGMRVPFRDDTTGETFTVFVPDRIFSADNVRSFIEAKLEQTRAVAALGGSTAATAG